MLRNLIGYSGRLHTLLGPRKHRKWSHCYRKSLSITPQKMSANQYEDPEIVKFLDDAHRLMVEEVLQKGASTGAKVVEFEHPEKLKELLQLPIGEEPESKADILDHCRRVIKYSVKTVNARFFNQLYSGVDPFCLAGAWLTDSLNTNLHTFEVSPVFVVMEKYLMKKMCGIVGFKEGDGIFCPGGSMCNIFAAHLARLSLFPEVKVDGMYGMKKMILYTSEEGHYSLSDGAGFLGFGTSCVVKVKTDDRGRIIPKDLEKNLQQDKEKGNLPIMVLATSGTTVLGAYDPINEIADICSKYDVWLHVDGAWGGGVILSKSLRHLMSGVERANSVTWNLHKMTNTIIQSSVLLLKREGLLETSYKSYAEYLFQPDKNYDVSFDIGDKTVQCGRKVDALKVWLMWKALGDKGMEDRVNRAFDNSRYLAERIRQTEGFRLTIPEFECTNTCFWYIPPSLRGQKETQEWWEKVSMVAPKIKERMMEQGTMLIGYTRLTPKGFVNFFRVIISNPQQTHSDMDFLIEEVDRLGRDL